MRRNLLSFQLARLSWKHRMDSDILPAQNYVELLRQRYPKLDFPAYKLRQWYSKTNLVFFDCKQPDKEACLHEVLKNTGYAAFIVFVVAKEQSGAYKLMDASFRNLGTESLEHFVTRFHSQLESMTRLGMQATGLEYIECVGHGYIEVWSSQ